MSKGIYKEQYNIKCLICECIFVTQRKNSKYCNNICRNIDWRANNKEKHHINQRNWISSNLERHSINQSQYQKRRKSTDIEYRLRYLVKARLGRIKYSKSIKTIEWLGCSMSELKLHLESKLTQGMNWENYGLYGWHIDHVIPLSSFDLTDDIQLKVACNYTNLQPLWAKDNLVKSNKIIKEKEHV